MGYAVRTHYTVSATHTLRRALAMLLRIFYGMSGTETRYLLPGALLSAAAFATAFEQRFGARAGARSKPKTRRGSTLCTEMPRYCI